MCKCNTLSGTLPAASISCPAWTSLFKLSHDHPQFCTRPPEPSPNNQSVFQPHLLKKSLGSTVVFHCQRTKEGLSFQSMSPSVSERTGLVSERHLKNSITFLSPPHLEVKKTTIYGVFFLPVVTKTDASKQVLSVGHRMVTPPA